METTKLSLDELKERIGNNIRIIREFKKVTQKSLYEQINKSQPTLSRYENGQSSMSVDTLFEICNYLDIPIEIVISKDLSLDDYSYVNTVSKCNVFQNYKHYFEDRDFNLYYFSTSQDDYVVEADLVTARLEKEDYIPFLFEVKNNNPDKQLYEGSLVLETQHAYFYFKNKNRNERGLIITYLYPQKNKNTPITLLGMMISISHGYELRPCSQKCFITSQKMDSQILKPFLKMDYPDDSFINNVFIKFLPKSADRKIYDLFKDNL